MGNIWYAPKCEPVVHGSVINLSDDCVAKLMNEKVPKKSTQKKNFPLEEQRYFEQMKCMDDEHGKIYGVSFEGFKKVADELEKNITSNKAVPCAKHKLLKCLRDHDFCMIKCRRELDKFIDCVDAYRLEVIKAKFKKEMHADEPDTMSCPIKKNQ